MSRGRFIALKWTAERDTRTGRERALLRVGGRIVGTVVRGKGLSAWTTILINDPTPRTVWQHTRRCVAKRAVEVAFASMGR